MQDDVIRLCDMLDIMRPRQVVSISLGIKILARNFGHKSGAGSKGKRQPAFRPASGDYDVSRLAAPYTSQPVDAAALASALAAEVARGGETPPAREEGVPPASEGEASAAATVAVLGVASVAEGAANVGSGVLMAPEQQSMPEGVQALDVSWPLLPWALTVYVCVSLCGHVFVA